MKYLEPKDLKAANPDQCWNTRCREYSEQFRLCCKKGYTDEECECRYELSDYGEMLSRIASDDAYRKVGEFIKDYYALPTVMTAKQFKRKWGIWDDNPWICLREWLKGEEANRVVKHHEGKGNISLTDIEWAVRTVKKGKKIPLGEVAVDSGAKRYGLPANASQRRLKDTHRFATIKG